MEGDRVVTGVSDESNHLLEDSNETQGVSDTEVHVCGKIDLNVYFSIANTLRNYDNNDYDDDEAKLVSVLQDALIDRVKLENGEELDENGALIPNRRVSFHQRRTVMNQFILSNSNTKPVVSHRNPVIITV